MKSLRVRSKDFLETVAHLKPIVKKQSTLPILGSVLLSADQKALSLEATNLEWGMKCYLDCSFADQVKVLLPFRELHRATSGLFNDSGWLTIAFPGDRKTIFTQGERTFELESEELPEEFPLFPDLAIFQSIASAHAGPMATAMDYAASFASTDKSKATLQHVAMELGKASLRFVGADGFKLGYATVDSFVSSDPEMFLLSTDVIRGMLPVLDPRWRLSIYRREKTIAFGQPQVEVWHVCDDGKYPGYRAVIIDGAALEVSVPSKLFLKAVKQLGPLVQGNGISLEGLTQEGFRLSTTGENSKASIAVEVNGFDGEQEAFDALVNRAYLESILIKMTKGINTDEVKILASGPDKPIVVSPTSLPANFLDAFAMVMPIRKWSR